LIMAMLVAGAVWVAGIPRRWFLIAGFGGLLGIAGLTITSANRMARIGNWFHGICEGDSCYQSDQGLMGLAEGGWWGDETGEYRRWCGRQPGAEDDYIFGIIGEELDLIGTLGVLALFSVLALLMFRRRTRLEATFLKCNDLVSIAWLVGRW